jgi:transcriptional regulator NrdR family protein
MSERGIKCPVCGCTKLPQVYTRHAGAMTVRVRECAKCLERVRTREIIVARVRTP